jgi:hypothetical protein
LAGISKVVDKKEESQNDYDDDLGDDDNDWGDFMD